VVAFRRVIRGALAICLLAVLVGAGPANALDISYPLFRSWEATGKACGDTDTLRVPLGPKRSFVSMRTKVGDPMQDNGTLLTTARVVRVKKIGRPIRAVRFTAEGSDDTCTNPDRYLVDGWMAWHTVGINTTERVPVYMAGYGNWKPRRPSTVYFGASQRIYGIRWASWGKRIARGRGIYPTSDCVPNCAEGTITHRVVDVRASYPLWCKGEHRYLVLRYRFRDNHMQGKAKFGYACGLGPNTPHDA
jgi:hypothetical protein